jgi:hypothetical protein
MAEPLTISIGWGADGVRVAVSGISAPLTVKEWEGIRAHVAERLPGWVLGSFPMPDPGVERITYIAAQDRAVLNLAPEA